MILHLTNRSGLQATFSTGSQVEITSRAVHDKGLSKIISRKHSPLRVYAVGDGANDFGLLVAADECFTFADGAIELKAIPGVRRLSENRSVALVELGKALDEGLSR